MRGNRSIADAAEACPGAGTTAEEVRKASQLGQMVNDATERNLHLSRLIERMEECVDRIEPEAKPGGEIAGADPDPGQPRVLGHLQALRYLGTDQDTLLARLGDLADRLERIG